MSIPTLIVQFSIWFNFGSANHYCPLQLYCQFSIRFNLGFVNSNFEASFQYDSSFAFPTCFAIFNFSGNFCEIPFCLCQPVLPTPTLLPIINMIQFRLCQFQLWCQFSIWFNFAFSNQSCQLQLQCLFVVRFNLPLPISFANFIFLPIFSEIQF